MNARRKAGLAMLTTALALGSAFASGCGNPDADQDPTPITTQPITPAAPRTPVATATAEATATADPNETPSAGTTLTLVAKDIEFDTDELEAPAGPITFVVDNQDAGVPHNVHIYKGKDVKGESMGKTKLVNGPSVDEVTLDLDADGYFFICDAHPNMKGKLTVN